MEDAQEKNLKKNKHQDDAVSPCKVVLWNKFQSKK